MSNILEYCLFIASIYYLFNLFKMKATGEIPLSFISKKVRLDRAKDIPGFIKYMFPRGLVFGIGLFIFSGVIIFSENAAISPYIKLLCEALYIALVIYFSVISVRAQKKFLF